MSVELWRRIENTDFKPYYEVSSYGRVRSYWDDWEGRFIAEPYIMEQRPFHNDGYDYVQMFVHDRPWMIRVEKLVADVFVDPDGGYIRHIDGDINNNLATNIEVWRPKISAIDKPVYAINWRTEMRWWYHSIRACADDLGLQRSAITRCLNGKGLTSGLYKFRYASEEKSYKIHEQRRIVCVNIDTEEVMRFDSQSMASRLSGLNQGNINKCLRHKLRRVGRFVFVYEDEYDW